MTSLPNKKATKLGVSSAVPAYAKTRNENSTAGDKLSGLSTKTTSKELTK